MNKFKNFIFHYMKMLERKTIKKNKINNNIFFNMKTYLSRY